MKKIMLTSLTAVVLLGISGCAKEETKSSEVNETKVTTSSSTITTKSSTDTVVNKEKNDSVDWNDIQATLKKCTEAEKMTTLFESNEIIKNGNDQMSVSLNGYQYIKLENVSRDFRIPFGDQVKEGGVLLVAATFENNSNKSIYTDAGFTMMVTGFDASISRNNSLLDNDLVSDLVDTKFEIKPNETLSGYVALSIKPEAMDKITKTGTGEFELPGFYSKPDSFSKEDTLVEPKNETIPLSSSGEASKKEASKYFEDKVTVDNMGTKKMIVEKEMNETKTFEEASVTVAGYQLVEFEPNEDQAPRFSNLEKGIVLLTAKLIVKNDGDEALNVDSTSATLTIGNTVQMMSENMLQVDTGVDNVEKGQEAIKYVVFTMDKESYDKLYKDQNYLLDVSLYNTKFERMTAIDDLSYELKK